MSIILIILLVISILFFLILYMFFVPFKLKGYTKIKNKEVFNLKFSIRSYFKFFLLKVYFIDDLYIDISIFWGLIKILKDDVSFKINQKNELLVSKKNIKNSRVKKILKKLKTTIQNKAKEKYKNVYKNKTLEDKFSIKDIFFIVENKENKEGLIKIFDILNKYIKKNKIKFSDSYINFALDEPSYTGITLGVLSNFSILYDNDLDIKPDFNSDCRYIDLNINLNGKISLKNIYKLLIELRENDKIRVLKKNWEETHGKGRI